MNIFGKRSNLPLIFSRTSDRKKEKSLVSFTHDQSIICSQTQLDDIAHEQTIICRQLFAGHLVDFRPMKKRKNLHGMIIIFIFLNSSVGRGTPGMRLYTTVILVALFMFYLLRNYLCFSLFFPTVFLLYWFGGPFICCSLHCISVCRVSHDATGETDF